MDMPIVKVCSSYWITRKTETSISRPLRHTELLGTFCGTICLKATLVEAHHLGTCPSTDLNTARLQSRPVPTASQQVYPSQDTIKCDARDIVLPSIALRCILPIAKQTTSSTRHISERLGMCYASLWVKPNPQTLSTFLCDIEWNLA